jgi:tRNA G18 (ribose-2'-O)-methylase SpoU
MLCVQYCIFVFRSSNEKEGIPVELISLLDVCVEIPQQGVVRSLNVHVSGAILIWEYRRQQLMKAVSS